MNTKKLISIILAVLLVFAALPVLAEGNMTNEQKLSASYLRMQNAINEKDYETAKDYINICFAYCDRQANPDIYAELLLKRGCIDSMQGKNDMALLFLDAAIATDPGLADAYMVRADIYSSTGELVKAAADLEKYIELSQDTSMYETLAQLQEASGNLPGAQEAWAKYMENAGTELEDAEFQNGVYKMGSGDLEGAIASFENYLENETYAAGAYFNIGLCRIDLQDYAGAVEAFNKCEEKGGTYDGLYYYRGISCLLNTAFEDAEASFNASIEKNESYKDSARYNLALTKYYAEDYEAAIAAFTDYIDNGEEGRILDYGAYYFRALAEGAAGRLEEAISDYTVCIENNYLTGSCYYNRAKVYEALGDTEHQNADLEAALKNAD